MSYVKNFLVLLAMVAWPHKAVSQGAIGRVHPLKNCENFPFFEKPKWEDYAKNANLTTEIKEYSGYSQGPWYKPERMEYSLEVKVPSFADYIGRDADRCFQEKDPYSSKSFGFELTAQLEGPSDLSEVREFDCKYFTLRDLLSNSLEQCREKEKGEDFRHYLKDGLEFNISACGHYKLGFTAKSLNGNNTWANLGTVSIDLPHFTRMVQVGKGFDYAKLAFDPNMKTCFPNRTYVVKCGSATYTNVKEVDTVVVRNLFPGFTLDTYTCTYSVEDTNNMSPQNISVQPKNYPFPFYNHPSAFSSNDHGIFLVNDTVAEALVSPDLELSVEVSSLDRNVNLTVTGHDAVAHGVTGLRHATRYKTCLKVEQVKGTCTFECQRRKWCHIITTLPPLSEDQGDLSGLWILGFFLVVLLAGVMILLAVVWIRLNALGAPALVSAWIQLKKKGKDNYEAEDPFFVKEH